MGHAIRELGVLISDSCEKKTNFECGRRTVRHRWHILLPTRAVLLMIIIR